MFHGSIAALVTPMTTDNSVDYNALERLIAWHIEVGTNALVVLGTTAEAPALSEPESKHIIRMAVEQAKGKCPVIVGTGTNNLEHTIANNRTAMDLGADAVLVVTPYYVRPTQHGLYYYHKAVAEACAIPQILYNNPTRTCCDLLPATAAKLSKISNIIAIKDCSGELARVKQILEMSDGRLDYFSGNDPENFATLREGGKGVISVIANVRPRLMMEMCAALAAGDIESAITYDQMLTPLYRSIFADPNPIGIKWALHHEGLIDSGIRLPLTWLAAEHEAAIDKALENTKEAEMMT